jgi:hypothetical protein
MLFRAGLIHDDALTTNPEICPKLGNNYEKNLQNS